MVRQVVIGERAAVTSEDFIASNIELIIAQAALSVMPSAGTAHPNPTKFV